MTDAPDFPEIEVATKALIAAIEAAARALPPGDGADALKAERRLVRRYRKAVEDINNGVWAAITQKQNSAREKKADGKRARVAAEHAAWMKEHAAWMAMTDEQKAAERPGSTPYARACGVRQKSADWPRKRTLHWNPRSSRPATRRWPRSCTRM